MRRENYVAEKEVILLDSSGVFDVDYCLYFNGVDRGFGIRPSPQEIYSDCVMYVRNFVKEIDRLDFRMVRT